MADQFDLTGSLSSNGGPSVLTLTSSDSWEVYSSNFSSVTPNKGYSGTTEITVNYPANTSDSNKTYQIEFKRSGSSLHRIFTFSVAPNN